MDPFRPGSASGLERARVEPPAAPRFVLGPAADVSDDGSSGQVQATTPVQAPPLQAPPLEPAPGNPVAVITTSFGDITVELFKDRAPVSVENFLQYASDGFYAGTIFHRVKPRFMIQGGGYTDTLTEKPTRPPIQNEATNGLRNTRGTLAMARLATLRSATSQFYINVVDNRSLDHRGFSPTTSATPSSAASCPAWTSSTASPPCATARAERHGGRAGRRRCYIKSVTVKN